MTYKGLVVDGASGPRLVEEVESLDHMGLVRGLYKWTFRRNARGL